MLGGPPPEIGWERSSFMRQVCFWVWSVLLLGQAVASGFDLGASVRGTNQTVVMGSAGVAVDVGSLGLRASMLLGAPQNRTLLTAQALFSLPSFILTPYLGGGAAMSTPVGSGFSLEFRDLAYYVATVGFHLPERGYRPYFEASQFFGLGSNESFTRFTVGFIIELF